MHHDELDIDSSLVRRLLASQFRQWAELPIDRIEPTGTDNAIYRLGDDMVMRLPRVARTVATLEKERAWLPRLAPHLPLAVPVPLAEGTPTAGYPWVWSVYRWLEGTDATVEPIADLGRAASDLARFIAALQSIDATGGPTPGAHNFFRGEALAARDAAVRASIAALGDEIEVDAITAAWEATHPPRAGLAAASCLDSRRPRRAKRACRGRTAERRHRLGLSRCRRSRVRRDGRVEASVGGHARHVPGSARGRRRNVDARPRLGALPGAERAVVLHARDECRARARGSSVADRSPRRSPAGDTLTDYACVAMPGRRHEQ